MAIKQKLRELSSEILDTQSMLESFIAENQDTLITLYTLVKAIEDLTTLYKETSRKLVKETGRNYTDLSTGTRVSYISDRVKWDVEKLSKTIPRGKLDTLFQKEVTYKLKDKDELYKVASQHGITESTLEKFYCRRKPQEPRVFLPKWVKDSWKTIVESEILKNE